MLLAPRAALLLAITGCTGKPPGGCMEPFAGDPAKPIEIVLVLDVPVAGGAKLVELKDGDRVDLQPPPQGGFVLYAGAKVKNFDPCGALVGGILRDPATNAVRSNADRRSADFELEPGGTGWWIPKALDKFSNVSNVPVCPDDLGAGVVDQMLKLEVTVTDRGGRKAQGAHVVVPVCPPGSCEAECRCTCGPDYKPGKCGGAVDGGARTDGGGLCGRAD